MDAFEDHEDHEDAIVPFPAPLVNGDRILDLDNEERDAARDNRPNEQEPGRDANRAPGLEDAMDDDDNEDADEDTDTSKTITDAETTIVHVLNPPPSSPLRTSLSGASNLTVLRLLNDVDVRRVLDPPAGTKRIKPPNRLVDYHGWQEVYTGKTLWVYDRTSNADQCARLVSQRSASLYGTAT